MAALTTVAAVRDYLQKSDNGQDHIITDLITRASAVITAYCAREFTPAGTATRRFPVSGRLLDLTPYDLRSTTGAVLNPESPSPTPLARDVDYVLAPVNGTIGGTYVQIRLSAYLVTTSSALAQRFGFAYLDVTGAWGMTAVPPDVEQACIDTVAGWMRGDVQAFSSSFTPDEPGVIYQSGGNLPLGVRYKLGPWRRQAWA